MHRLNEEQVSSKGSTSGRFEWTEQVPISFTRWKTILSKLTKEEMTNRLFL